MCVSFLLAAWCALSRKQMVCLDNVSMLPLRHEMEKFENHCSNHYTTHSIQHTVRILMLSEVQSYQDAYFSSFISARICVGNVGSGHESRQET